MAEYRLTPAARRDLASIWAYTRRQWDVAQANHYIDLLAAAFTELARSPLTAPACNHIRKGYRRRSVERHVVYFRITSYGIDVIRILHERMEMSRHI